MQKLTCTMVHFSNSFTCLCHLTDCLLLILKNNCSHLMIFTSVDVHINEINVHMLDTMVHECIIIRLR